MKQNKTYKESGNNPPEENDLNNILKKESFIINNNSKNDQQNFLNSSKYKNSNDNSSLNNNFLININENRPTNELKEIRNSYENDYDNSMNERNSNEIIIKSVKEILDENTNPDLKKIILNNQAKKIQKLFISLNQKLGEKCLSFNNNSPSKLNKIANKKKDKNYKFITDDSMSDIIKDGFGVQMWLDGSKFA